MRIYLRLKFEAMGISIGRDAFAALLDENRMLDHRPRSKRKTTLRKWKNYPSQGKGREVFVPLSVGTESQGVAGNGSESG